MTFVTSTDETPPNRRAIQGLTALVAFVVALAVGVTLITRTTNRGDGAGASFGVPLARTFEFAPTLTEMGIFDPSHGIDSLEPAPGFHVYELSSTLYSDGSSKDRLLSVPEGTVIEPAGDGMVRFPEGSILVKTFSYEHDERDPDLGRRIIETRLLVLSGGSWNVATYIWNDAQDDAFLELEGRTIPITWIDSDGIERSIDYGVPDENTCVACHQSQQQITPLGPELQFLNFDVERDGATTNQLAHLVDAGVLTDLDPTTVAAGIDYLDTTLSISDRGRAYLDMNCSHCHNPSGWSRPAGEGLDLRIETPLDQTGILDEHRSMARNVANGQMPFFGTTAVDPEGLAILEAYFDDL